MGECVDGWRLLVTRQNEAGAAMVVEVANQRIEEPRILAARIRHAGKAQLMRHATRKPLDLGSAELPAVVRHGSGDRRRALDRV